ncbi:MAG TPA: hypothetical protein VFG23_17915 [Polyangia bacterium]|nr:hypothetical protein [Polyangia bacterium]
MRSFKWVVVSVLMVALSSASAFATTASEVAPVVPLPKASLLADSVVVTPQAQQAPAAQPAAPAAVPVAAAPVEEVPSRRTTVVHEDAPNRNYMSTIAVSAIMGAVLGALVGGSIYYLGNQEHAARIGYWAAGGVILGTAVGLTQIVVQENRADVAVASRFPTDPVPTYRLALLNLRF